MRNRDSLVEQLPKRKNSSWQIIPNPEVVPKFLVNIASNSWSWKPWLASSKPIRNCLGGTDWDSDSQKKMLQRSNECKWSKEPSKSWTLVESLEIKEPASKWSWPKRNQELVMSSPGNTVFTYVYADFTYVLFARRDWKFPSQVIHPLYWILGLVSNALDPPDIY